MRPLGLLTLPDDDIGCYNEQELIKPSNIFGRQAE